MANFNVDIGDAGLAVEQSVAPPSYTLAGAFGNAINTYNRGQSKGSTRAPTEDEQLGLYLKSAGEATDGLSGTNASVKMQEVIVKLRRNGIILSSDSAAIFEAQYGVNPNGFMGDAEEQAEQDYQLQYSAAASDSTSLAIAARELPEDSTIEQQIEFVMETNEAVQMAVVDVANISKVSAANIGKVSDSIGTLTTELERVWVGLGSGAREIAPEDFAQLQEIRDRLALIDTGTLSASDRTTFSTKRDGLISRFDNMQKFVDGELDRVVAENIDAQIWAKTVFLADPAMAALYGEEISYVLKPFLEGDLTGMTPKQDVYLQDLTKAFNAYTPPTIEANGSGQGDLVAAVTAALNGEVDPTTTTTTGGGSLPTGQPSTVEALALGSIVRVLGEPLKGGLISSDLIQLYNTDKLQTVIDKYPDQKEFITGKILDSVENAYNTSVNAFSIRMKESGFELEVNADGVANLSYIETGTVYKLQTGETTTNTLALGQVSTTYVEVEGTVTELADKYFGGDTLALFRANTNSRSPIGLRMLNGRSVAAVNDIEEALTRFQGIIEVSDRFGGELRLDSLVTSVNPDVITSRQDFGEGTTSTTLPPPSSDLGTAASPWKIQWNVSEASIMQIYGAIEVGAHYVDHNGKVRVKDGDNDLSNDVTVDATEGSN